MEFDGLGDRAPSCGTTVVKVFPIFFAHPPDQLLGSDVVLEAL